MVHGHFGADDPIVTSELGSRNEVVSVVCDDCQLTATLQDDVGMPVLECLHSGFYWS